MKPAWNYYRSCVLLIWLFSFLSSELRASDARDSVQNPEPPVPAMADDLTEWITRLEYSADLLNNSSLHAEQVSQETYEAALAMKADQFAAVALMQRACARMQAFGLQYGADDFQKALDLMPATAAPSTRLLFIQAAIQFERFSGRGRREHRAMLLEQEIALSGQTARPSVVLRATCALFAIQLEHGPVKHEEFVVARNLSAAAGTPGYLAWIGILEIRNSLMDSQRSNAGSEDSETVDLTLSKIAELSRHLFANSQAIECNLLSADLCRAAGRLEQERHYLETALQSAMQLEDRTRIAECQFRLAVCDEIRHEPPTESLATEAFLDAVDLINDRDLLRGMVITCSLSPGGKVDEDLLSLCLRRINRLNAINAATASILPMMRADRIDGVVEELSSELLSREQQTIQQNSRSLLLARIGFAVFCGLALILLRERRLLREANRRLKNEMLENERQQQERERIELQLAQTERLESLGTIAGGIAHDFNNLLVGVIGNAELLRAAGPVSNRAQDYIDGILHSAETAADLSRKMLAYAGKQASTKRPVEMNSLLEKMLPLFRAGLGTRHAIHFLPSASSLWSEADTTQLEQIAMNLVTNAFQAMGDQRGTIQIQTGYCTLKQLPVDPITLGNRKSGGDFVWFEVRDNGPGIPEHIQPRIFEPFFSTRHTSGGHGFGLSVVYGHVNRHNGLIQLTSRSGEGTVFRILLPLSATEESAPTVPVPTHIRLTSDGPCDVLVVDDRLDVLDVVEKTLTAAGLRTFAYSSSTEALEYLAENSEVGCLVLDIMMPDVDGMAMLQEMAEKGLSIPVVVMSGYSPVTPESFHQYPVVKSVVQKPFRQELILSSVLEAMSEKSRALIKGSN